MKRRAFIAGLGGVAAWPVATRGQQPALPVVGFLSGGSHDAFAPYVTAFRRGLSESNYIEGQNLTIEYRWAEGHYDRLPTLMADLLDRKCAAIVAMGNVAARDAKAAAETIPVVFSTGSDPVAIGLVKSLSRPGTNMTGVSILNNDLESKRFELLIEVVPDATLIAFLVNPDSPTTPSKLRSVNAAAEENKRQVLVLNARNDHEFEDVFQILKRQGVHGLMIASDNIFANQALKFGEVTALNNVPSISAYHDFVSAGGLMSYGSSEADAYRQLGVYAGKIVKGEKPADLPVVQLTKVTLVLNLKSAKTLDITFPLSVLGRADEVIE
jgi:putative tryptophan/tyrosine transport system substrate-binding protein